MTNGKSCAVCGQPIRDGESHSRMGRGVGADPRYRHGHVIGDLRPCLNAAIARAKAAEADAARWLLSATEKPAAFGVEVDVRATGLYDEAGWSIYIDGDIVASYAHHHPAIQWRPAPPQE